ncbi:two component transcriptional regulator, LytTR family [Janthinobacterium sp. TND4EL3]|uniref:LytR/AlgR family response regulator transcription factor n=1 Tax=Janthinobacterium sp. TND4EL3 TaxID=1907311 RepID=UPI00095405CD|nr:LytTR family DNA-binding domain-containing protein [Janthinobacterium sp. TND4EL3]SIR53569.1 two component transcriptional regulator, LytTR family [Janthinobacterium sp. TND4EL3]
MPTAILADDEPHMRAALRQQLLALWPELCVLGEAEDGIAALAMIEALQPEIAFLDIRMPGLTGLQVAHALQASTRVVFVTAFDNHALQAFEANAVDYVLKPLDTARLAKVVAKLRLGTAPPSAPLQDLAAALAQLGIAVPSAAPPPRLEWLHVAVGKEVCMLHIDDVYFFEADSKYTRVVGEGCDGLIRHSLRQLTDQLDAGLYLQTHRSTLVNRRYIRAVHRHGETMEIELKVDLPRLKVSLPNHHLFRAM